MTGDLSMVKAHERGPPPPVGRPAVLAARYSVVWRYGDGPLAAGAAISRDGDPAVPHHAEPVTVVRDDADSLIAWLAAGRVVLQAARADGLGKREDKSTLFTADTVQAIGVWTDYDVLRIAVPTSSSSSSSGSLKDKVMGVMPSGGSSSGGPGVVDSGKDRASSAMFSVSGVASNVSDTASAAPGQVLSSRGQPSGCRLDRLRRGLAGVVVAARV